MATFSQSELASSPYSWLQDRPKKEADSFSPLLRVSEASKLLGCCPAHVRRLIAAGTLRAIRFGKRGSHRIPLSELIRVGALKEQNNDDK
jgi:excisionase family DNA binding protein